MKKYLKELNSYGYWIFLTWIFTIPFQLYLNSGISVSVSILLILPMFAVISINVYREGVKGFTSLISRHWLILFIAISILLSSIINITTFEDKEFLRWYLFLIQLVIFLEALRLRVIKIEQIVLPFILGSAVMILLTFYQVFVPQEVELQLMKGVWGKLFNDPDFITERFSGVGKFNWLYGNSIRVHGVFANVSHFAFLLGASLLLLIRERRFKWNWAYTILGTVLFAFITMSLVRSVALSLLVIFLIYIIIAYREKLYTQIKLLFIIVLGGTIFALILGYFSYERVIYYSLIVRFFETVSFDGALFPKQMESLRSYFDRVQISSGQFNEYGGVGGRFALFKITVAEIIIPRITNLPFLLFGIGPASLPHFLKNATNEYFGAFRTVDNSYLQWVVEIGLTPFILGGYYIKKGIKNLLPIFYRNWDIILYTVINALFFNILPDIRMGMVIVVLISYSLYKNGK